MSVAPPPREPQSTPWSGRGSQPAERSAWLAAGVAAAVILACTLWPDVAGRRVVGFFELSHEATADAIRNIVLFAPLGAALAATGLPMRRIVLATFLLSTSVELAQLYIPGRDASLYDVAANTVGATLACVAWRRRARWLRPRAGAASRLAVMAALALAATLAATGGLLQTSFPATQYWSGWTPDFAQLAIYRGRLYAVMLGDLAIANGRQPDSAAVRAGLAARAPLRIEGVAGPQTRRLAPLVTLQDEDRRQLLLLGAERNDAVVRVRRIATALGFTTPELVFRGALGGLQRGGPLRLELAPGPRSTCLVINGASSCGVGERAAHGWALIAGREWVPVGLERLADAAWLVALALPVGFWLRPRRQGPALLAIGICAASLIAIPHQFGLLPPSLIDWASLLAGLGCGVWLRRRGPPSAAPFG